jgi:flagellar basal-body rod modification protein FlgD
VNGTQYVRPETRIDDKGNLVSTPAPGMDELAKISQRQTSNKFDGETFLKLLVAQLKYQDPSKPTDTADMMAQTAQLSMVERVNQMAESAEAMVKATQALATTEETMAKSYATLVAEQRMSSAVGLVGRVVTFGDPADPKTSGEGRVESVKFDPAGPILRVDGKDVPYASVTSIKADTPALIPVPVTDPQDPAAEDEPAAPAAATIPAPSGDVPASPSSTPPVPSAGDAPSGTDSTTTP